MKFVDFTPEDKTLFETLILALSAIKDIQINPLIKKYLEFVKIHCTKSDNLSVNWEEFYQLFKQVYQQLDLRNKKAENHDISFDDSMALFLLLNTALANNALIATALKFSSASSVVKVQLRADANKYNTLLVELLKTIERLFLPNILKNPPLRDLKKRICLIVQGNDNQTNKLNTDREVIISVVQRKNEASMKFGTKYNGMYMYVPDSDFMYTVDPDLISLLMSSLELIMNGKQLRTQFLLSLGAFGGHMLVLDASLNQQTKKLELICVDSAKNFLQWQFIQLLTTSLKAKSVPYELLACFANVQKDAGNCKMFSLAISTKIKDFTLSQLRPVAISSKKLRIPFVTPVGGTPPVLAELPELPDVLWFPNQALGFDIIKMHQSMTDMEDDLMYLAMEPYSKEEDVEKTQQAFVRKKAELQTDYNFDLEAKETYIDYRIQSLTEKLDGTLYQGLTVDGVVSKIGATTPDQALRRFATGRGPKREMAFLLESEDVASFIDKRDETKQQRTALHWAFIEKRVGRACLLLEKSAKFNLPDKKEKTALDYFNESDSPVIKDNEYIQRKLGILK